MIFEYSSTPMELAGRYFFIFGWIILALISFFTWRKFVANKRKEKRLQLIALFLAILALLWLISAAYSFWMVNKILPLI